MLTALLGLNTDELRLLAREEGVPAYRGGQIAEWLYGRGVHAIQDMANLPDGLRARLSEKYEAGQPRVVTMQESRDGTFKLLLEMTDGARVETVGLPYADRFSCCVSTQVGCPVGCVFCATGLDGYTRNLTAGEIVGQVLAVQEAARGRPLPEGITNGRVDHVVFMGMGEPLLNYEATLKALSLLNAELGISARNLTVSTAGFVPGIFRLAGEKLQITLAVSLHVPTDELRRQLVPGMKWSITEIIEACREYVKQTGRRVTFEYCLLNGVNDGEAQARELARVLRGLNCHVNLIPHNPVSGPVLSSVGGAGSRGPSLAESRERIGVFRKILEERGIQVTQRAQRGADIDAACGQLRRRVAEKAR